MSKTENIAENLETIVPMVITPPEVSELHKRLDEVDENVEFVAGEVWQREGIRLGGHVGFLYGLMTGLAITLLLKFVFQLF